MKRGVPQTYPCVVCGHNDARDRSHQRGCPALPPVPPARLLALARAVEDGWIADEENRAHLNAIKAEARRAGHRGAMEPRNAGAAVARWRTAGA